MSENYEKCEEEDPTDDDLLKPWEYVMNTCACCGVEIPSYCNLCEVCKAREEKES